MKRKTYNRFRWVFDGLLLHRIPYLSHILNQKVYNNEFFDDANQMKVKTAKQVAAIINSFFDYNTIFDIGCGMGLYINEFRKIGKMVLGCDYSDSAIKMASKDFLVFKADVTKPILVNQIFDLVMCFEVAEHIHTRYSSQLVSNCTAFGNTVIFTAAPVGQGGVGHINEQPYEFWIDLFEKHNFRYNRPLSEAVRKILHEEYVVDWLANNFMCFERNVVQ